MYAKRAVLLISARTGTAHAGVRTDLHNYLRGATALAEGSSIRATRCRLRPAICL